jgi:hypothetical protein
LLDGVKVVLGLCVEGVAPSIAGRIVLAELTLVTRNYLYLKNVIAHLLLQ